MWHDTTNLLRDLVAIDSVNPSLVADAAGEQHIARFVAAWLEQAGLEVQVDQVAPGRPNVIGIARGRGGGRSLLLNAHLDTVGVAGMEQPHTPVIRRNRLYGRGAYDMKGGLAAAMVAAAAAKQHGLRGDVLIAAVVDEEYGSIGTEALVQRHQADAAIVTEPTHLQVCVAHKGFQWLEITTHGTAAHGSRPALGVDAIAKMGHVLVALDQLDRRLQAAPTHTLLGSGSLHASLIAGGQELSSYPERCTLSVERRTVPGEDQAVVEQQIEALLDQIARADPAFRATLHTTFARLPFEVDPGSAIVAELMQQAQGILDTPPPVIGETFWMDSAILGAAGIPTVIFGPTGAGAHAAVEWVDLDSVEQCARVLLATAAAFCA